jgi:uncharacterized RmlC-like cupin family protein
MLGWLGIGALLGVLATAAAYRPAGQSSSGVSSAADVVREPPRHTSYDDWFKAAAPKMPTFAGTVIDDIRTVPLRRWDSMGVDGLYVRMADYQMSDAWILELPPGGHTTSQRYLFEAGVYVFGGPGHTVLQQEGRPPQRIDWNARALFSIPLNVRYQHFNDSGTPVRLLVVTSFPFVLNAMGSERFILDNPFTFRDRYDGEAGYAEEASRDGGHRTLRNFLPDALASDLTAWDARGENTSGMHWSMAGNTMIDLHLSEVPPQLYKRAHRHSSDAFILLLSGEGYSLTWPGGRFDQRVRVAWHEGTLFAPPTFWYHQHLNPGTRPARYLAINTPNLVTNLGLRFSDQLETDLPQVEAEFREALARRGDGLQ